MQARGPVKRAPKKRSGFKPSAAGRAYAAPKYTPKPKPASRSDAAQRTGARTPKPKPYRPTPAQVGAARAQERAYKSQGRAIKKVSHVQKAQGVGRPTGGRTLVTRKEAARKAERGKRREREAKQITKLVGFDPRDRYGNTPRVTKTNVMKAPKGLEKAARLGYLETDPKKLKTAGFAPPGLAEKIVSSPKYAIKYGIAPTATDLTELAITTPSSLAKAGVEGYGAAKKSYEEKSPAPLAEHVGKLVKQTGEQYLDLAKHPSTLYKRPVTSALMLQPFVRTPGLALGKAARVTGKQTLRRPDVVLKGTALREQRHGSRDITVRALQSRSDRRAGRPPKRGRQKVKVKRGLEKTAPTIRVRAPRGRQMTETTRGGMRRSIVDQRTDEFRDFAQHIRNDTLKKHAKAAQKKAKGKSKDERAAIFAEEREKAVEAADIAVRAAFVKEFGTTERLSTSVSEVEAAKVAREAAGSAKKEAKGAVAAAKETQAKTLTEARVARAGGATRRSPLLDELQREQKRVGKSKRKSAERVYHGTRTDVAHPSRQQGTIGSYVSREEAEARSYAPYQGGHTLPLDLDQGRVLKHTDHAERERILKEAKAPGDGFRHPTPEQADRINAILQREGYDAVEMSDKNLIVVNDRLLRAPAPGRSAQQIRREIAQERKRISGVPPAQQDALLRANADLADARAAHAAARAAHKGVARTHKDLKRALANAELVDASPTARLYDSKAEATRVANLQDFNATTYKVGEQWGVVPASAKDRLRQHGAVGTSPAVGARELRTLSRSFRGSVLPLSLRWLFGQVSEATFRTAIEHGFNPFSVAMSLARERAVYRKLEKMEPGLGKAMRARAVRGGQFGSTSIQREFMGPDDDRTLGQEFEGTYAEGVAKKVSAGAQAPIVKQYREKVWHPYKHVIFNVVNGFAEESARRALTGRKIAQGPLMEKRILTLTDRAIEDAAKGLKSTEAQVQLARAVNRAYGKYSQFSPDMRSRLTHWTPFLPWYLNTAKFLFDVMPRDHPVITSLAANYSLATEDWRKEAGLSFHGKDRVPPWKLGTYKGKDGRFYHAGRYLPFSPGSPTEASGQAVFPQLLGSIDPLKTGRDWKGNQIKGGELGVLREALQSGVEAHVPGAALIGRTTGVSEKLRGKEARGGSVIENLGMTQSPFAAIPEGSKKKKVKVPTVGGGSSSVRSTVSGGSSVR